MTAFEKNLSENADEYDKFVSLIKFFKYNFINRTMEIILWYVLFLKMLHISRIAEGPLKKI